jgi:hypothetical protein
MEEMMLNGKASVYTACTYQDEHWMMMLFSSTPNAVRLGKEVLSALPLGINELWFVELESVHVKPADSEVYKPSTLSFLLSQSTQQFVRSIKKCRESP